MSKPAILAAMVCAALFVPLSCSKKSSFGHSGAPIPFDQYCQAYAEVTCEAADRCECLGPFSIDLCIQYQRSDCQDEVESPVDSGRMSYNSVAAGQCLGAISDIIADCSTEGDDWPESCDSMLQGAVQAGQYCDGDDECVSGLDCYQDTCTEMPGENQPCLNGSDCGSDRFCGNDDLCHSYRTAGHPCPEGDYACDDDLYCDSRTDTCQPYLGSGDSCAHDAYACDDDLYCSPSTQTCRPYPGSGQSCADSGGDCADDLYCDGTDTCRPQKPGGQSCSEDEECLSWDCVDNVCEEDEDDFCPI